MVGVRGSIPLVPTIETFGFFGYSGLKRTSSLMTSGSMSKWAKRSGSATPSRHKRLTSIAILDLKVKDSRSR